MRNCKKLIEEDFVLLVSDLVPDQKDHRVVTTEDLFPKTLYRKAIREFVDKWHPDLDPEKRQSLHVALDNDAFGSDGLAASTKKLFVEHVYEVEREYDKYGVFHEVLGLVVHGDFSEEDRSALEERLFGLCEKVRRAMSASQQAARRHSGKQAIQRLIDEFFVSHKESSSVFDLLLLLERIQRDLRSRSPVLRTSYYGCSITRHETQGTEVLPELSVLAGEAGCPRGSVEGARG